MKTTRHLSILIVVCLAFSLSGCETIKKVYAAGTVTVSEQTSDTLIVSAEKATIIGKDAMDTFLRLEFKHREAYAKISPQIHLFSIWLREPVKNKDGTTDPRGIGILKTARVATKALKANKTPENELNLRAALKTLQAVIDDTKKYTALALKPGQ